MNLKHKFNELWNEAPNNSKYKGIDNGHKYITSYFLKDVLNKRHETILSRIRNRCKFIKMQLHKSPNLFYKHNFYIDSHNSKRPNIKCYENGFILYIKRTRIKVNYPKWTDSYFKKRYSQLPCSKTIIQLTKCKNDHFKIKFKCRVCGNTFKRTPHFIFSGITKCPYCSKQKISTHIMQRKIHKKWGNKIWTNGKYKGARTKILFHCWKGHSWYTRPQVVMNGHGCPICELKQLKMSNSAFQKELNQEYDGKVINVETYRGTYKKIEFKCNKCGYHWYDKPVDLLGRTHGCPRCKVYMEQKRFRKSFLGKLYDKFKGTIIPITKVKYYEQKIEFECLICGCKFITRPGYLLCSLGCPKCTGRASVGEYFSMKYLNKLGLVKNKDYYYGYVFNSYSFCGIRLHADLYMPNIRYNNHYSNGIAIEFDGEQHFAPFHRHPTYYQFLDFACRVGRDITKNIYCGTHHIKLIRIEFPYTNSSNYFKHVKEVVCKTLNKELLHHCSKQLSLF